MRRLLPGLLLCGLIALAAAGLQYVEQRLFGRAWLEALVLAILIGVGVRTLWSPSGRWRPGIAFSGKMLLEVAVLLLGASISARTVMAVGSGLLLGIAGVVVFALLASYVAARLLGLPHRMALLVACGNSICGNSAIAAVAPVIGAGAEDVAASIAFTAVLGVGVVLALPSLVPLIHLSGMQYGVVAGLTVYAVPQVLAATAPIGAISVQIGTMVKLVRVLMLGPVICVLSLAASRRGRHATDGNAVPAGGRPPFHRLVPWFILGFIGLAALRSLDLLPPASLGPIAVLASLLTVLSMAALGLGVDLRALAQAGAKVTAAVTASLLLLCAVSLALIRLLGIS
ncbi:MAG: putative sulfate exporter family transporter [Alphaproteobacteria bacterium]|nr:putative sulfate exporter family transporter [Alphaproteobacteria bacterium]